MQTSQLQNPSLLYDIIILGASGFTGKYVVKEALKFLNTPASPLKNLAIAGRSHEKLVRTLQWAAHPNPLPPSVSIITADTTDRPSLLSLCRQTKVLLNCVGPFRIHGEPVVAACASSGCDYLDISGEPEFMERMEAKYHEKAVETGSLVVSACGFDSIPAEMGFMFNSRQWVAPAVPNHVDAYVSLESDKRIVGNFGTYESAVLGVANMDKLQEFRSSRPKRPRPVPLLPSPPSHEVVMIGGNGHGVGIDNNGSCCVVGSDGADVHGKTMVYAFLYWRIAELAAVGGRGGWIMVLPVIASFDIVQYLTWALLLIPGPPPSRGPMIEHQEKIGLKAVRLPSADAVVVRRTLVTLIENPHGLPGVNESVEHSDKREAFWSSVKPAHFGVKIGSKSLLGIYRIIGVGMFIGLLGRTSFGRWLLLKFPSFFSLGWFRKKGPSEDEVRSASFKMWFVGYGFSDSSLASQANSKPDMQIITRVMGPEIGYVTTPIVLLQCALILLSQRESLPKGGAFTPGVVFGPHLEERLQENGISFDLISKCALPA
ncbi:Mitochondrial saccharopine dehydrogenase isoform 1 [Theobroma cacao]|uniref:Mitochondrial saccharopine dehydrogenase isoform 1 n=1 Tax=Theobroma cacao TaxID=3641 RepID=A0A061EFY7_THECC|nr:Mitochondrial saccharopine dehydrogenase isoform 1 [Theobroma cacao]